MIFNQTQHFNNWCRKVDQPQEANTFKTMVKFQTISNHERSPIFIQNWNSRNIIYNDINNNKIIYRK